MSLVENFIIIAIFNKDEYGDRKIKKRYANNSAHRKIYLDHKGQTLFLLDFNSLF